MKKNVILSAIVLTAIFQVGCSPTKDEISSREVSVLKIIKPEHIPAFSNVISDFTEANNDIQIKFVDAPLSTGERHQMYISALDGKDSSIDLYWINDEWTAEFVEEGYVVPLSDGMRNNETEYIVDANELFSYDGSLYALPIGLDMDFIYSRSDVVNTLPQSWNDIISVCKQNSNGILPFSAENSDAQDILFNIIQICKAKNCSYAEALTFYKDIITDYYSTEGAAISFSSEFKTGNAVAMLGKASMRKRLNEEVSAVRGSVKMQTLPGDNSSVICCYGLALNSNSVNKDAALRFMHFLKSKTEMNRLSRECGVMPVIESLYDDEMILDANPYMRGNIKEIVKNASSCASFNISGESYRKIENVFLKYFNDDMAAEEAGAMLESLLI